MSKSLNRVELLGNLGRDADTKFTASGIARTTFSVATTRRIKDGDGWKDETDWHNVVLWRNEKLAEYLKKGTRLYIDGRLSTRNYEKDGAKVYVTEVVAEDVILCGGGSHQGDCMVSQPRGGQRQSQATEPNHPWAAADDDVPF